MKIKPGHIIAVGVIGVLVAFGFWFKNHASDILGSAAGKAIKEVTHNNEISLKDQLRNTSAQVLSATTAGMADAAKSKTENLFNKWFKVK